MNIDEAEKANHELDEAIKKGYKTLDELMARFRKVQKQIDAIFHAEGL